MGTAARRACVAGFATFVVLVGLVAQPSVASVDPTAPRVSITAPDDQKVFGPGDPVNVRGTATASRGVTAVRLEYWLLNKLERRVLASCTGCGTPAASWTDEPALKPGYYVVKAQAVDPAGVFSEPTQRSFLYALNMAPAPPALPPAPQTPKVPTPSIEPHPERLLPGATQPVPVSGTARPGTTVTAYEKEYGLGPLGSAKAGKDGRWTMQVRMPTGNFTVVAQAVDARGNGSRFSSPITFSVDAERPRLTLPSGDQLILVPPTEPVRIEGRVFDAGRIAAVYVEYWLLDRLALREVAQCPGCGTQSTLWSSTPEGLAPGYYYVQVKAFDAAGNPSYTSTTTVLKTGLA